MRTRDFIFTTRLSVCLSIKVLWLRSRSYEKNDNFTYFNMLIPCVRLQVMNEVRVTHQGEKVKVNVKVKISIAHVFT